MAADSDSRASLSAWTDLEPYAQLLRALMPRATGISVFDPRANLRWSSESATYPDLFRAVEASRSDAHADNASLGQLQMMEGGVPLYLCWLRDEEQGQLLAIVAIQCRASGEGQARAFALVHPLIRPALEALRRELASRVSLDLLAESLIARDRDLEMILAVSTRDGLAPGDDANALGNILDNAVAHLKCALAALLVPEKSLMMFRMPQERPADGQLLARTHRHLLSMAQVRREPLIMNRVAPNSALGALPYRILSCSLRNATNRSMGILALFRHESDGEFLERDGRLVDVLARKSAALIDSSYDALTGLLNRPAFEQRARALLGEPGTVKAFASLYLDVDQLHLVNENLGMHVGDLLLSMIGDLMRRALPHGAVAARISGDRFAVVVPGELDEVMDIAEKLREGIEQIVAVQGDERSRAAISIGVAQVEPINADLAHALAEAESACKAAKDRGRNRVEAYQATDESVIRRFADITIAGRLRVAISESRLRLDAQLILPVGTDLAQKPHYELLLRMIDDQGETIGPDRFLSAANRYQLMPTIDRWVIDSAVQLLRPHAEALTGAPVCFAINFSGQSLGDAEFGDYLITRVEGSGVDPRVFCFELTESATIANLARAEVLMRRLRKLGCGVALDDFGTGLSSLAYLRQLPVSMLKIDGSFVRDIIRDPRSESLVQAVAQLARSMQIATVAEYVETDEIRDRIAALGVDYVQGFAIGRPAPVVALLADFPALLLSLQAGRRDPKSLGVQVGGLH